MQVSNTTASMQVSAGQHTWLSVSVSAGECGSTYLGRWQTMLPKSRDNVTGTFLPRIDEYHNLLQHTGCSRLTLSQSVSNVQFSETN